MSADSRELQDLYRALIRRPEPLNGIEVPTVRNIAEVRLIGDLFGAVLTAGPDQCEVNFGFDNHRVWTFEDSVSLTGGPQLHQVEEMVFWGATQTDLLVHCHAGMSRSTATAWGVCIARGLDPYESLVALLKSQPWDVPGSEQRHFCPNRQLVEHLQDVFADNSLSVILDEVLRPLKASKSSSTTARFWLQRLSEYGRMTRSPNH